MIVAQARTPVFYREYGVPDTVAGRFDILLMHVALVVERLMREEPAKAFGQALFDRFCTDMDDNLREMGIGDLSVPKKMRALGEAYYGRTQAYRAALAEASDAALIEALARNIYGGGKDDAATRLAAYMRLAVRDLAAQPSEQMAGGRVHFPDPAMVAPVVGRV